MKEKMLGIFRDYYYLITSFLMFLSFPTCDIWICKSYTFFAWISLVPLFVYIRGRSYREILFSTFLSGLLGHLFVYNWIGYFGVGVGGKGGYILVLSFLIPSLTVFFTTKILIAEYLSRRFEGLRIFIYPSVWIIIDWVQSIGFLAFPWTYWGYSQFQFTPFIQVSSFTGIMGITFILVASNYFLSDFFHTIINEKIKIRKAFILRAGKNLVIFFIIVMMIILHGFISIKNSIEKESGDMRISIIQSCISPWDNWRRNRFKFLSELNYYTDLALKDDPDFIVWSESATLENISYNFENGTLDAFEKKVLDISRDSGKPLLTGEIGVVRDPVRHRYFPQNNAVLIDGQGNVVKSYAKINLVPFGEWFPYEKWLPYIKELTLQMGGSSFVPGKSPYLFELSGRKFGVLICYEGIFYRLCREYSRLGADYLINITNDGWTDSYAGHMQHFSASIFRAIENGVWYIRAGNTGLTALVDPYGRITSEIPILKKGYLTGEVNFSLNHSTFYSCYGDVFLYIIMMFICCTAVFALIKIRQ